MTDGVETASRVKVRRSKRGPKAPHSGSFGQPGRAHDHRAVASAGGIARHDPARRSIVDQCREMTGDALRVMREIMLAENARNADRIKAGELLLSYGHGRPSTVIDLSVSQKPRDIGTLSTAVLEAALVTGVLPFAIEADGQVIEGQLLPAIEHQPIEHKDVVEAQRHE